MKDTTQAILAEFDEKFTEVVRELGDGGRIVKGPPPEMRAFLKTALERVREEGRKEEQEACLREVEGMRDEGETDMRMLSSRIITRTNNP